MDVAILEVGLGGRLDATNAVPRPAVCGISTLGMDHMEILGDTLALIAGEKAGIMKAGVRCFTAPQLPEAAEVLERVSRAKGTPLMSPTPLEAFGDVPLGLAGDHQRLNAALAVALCREWGVQARPGDDVTAANEKVRPEGRRTAQLVLVLPLTCRTYAYAPWLMKLILSAAFRLAFTCNSLRAGVCGRLPPRVIPDRPRTSGLARTGADNLRPPNCARRSGARIRGRNCGGGLACGAPREVTGGAFLPRRGAHGREHGA